MINNSQKGFTLYFAIIMMSILLAAVFSIGSVVLLQIKTIKGMGDSIIAYYAADTGAEKALFEGKFIIPPDDTKYSATLNNNASYEATILATSTPQCSGSWYCIESIGNFQQTKRAVKITR